MVNWWRCYFKKSHQAAEMLSLTGGEVAYRNHTKLLICGGLLHGGEVVHRNHTKLLRCGGLLHGGDVVHRNRAKLLRCGGLLVEMWFIEIVLTAGDVAYGTYQADEIWWLT